MRLAETEKLSQSFVAFTDHPFTELGDKPNNKPPIRVCKVIADDGENVQIETAGQVLTVKKGYVYKTYELKEVID
jgi:hypothetical protein